MAASESIKITKFDAARRQLATAIELWFADGDLVSVHTLAFAAYEIIHVVTRPKRSRDLLFDSAIIKEEYRKEWGLALKKAANFFKHANKDAAGSLDFDPRISPMFIMFSILGVKLYGERLNNREYVFLLWMLIHNDRVLNAGGRKIFREDIPADTLNEFRTIPKQQFFKTCVAARRKAGYPD